MDKPWLKNYPPGVPAEIDVHEFESVKDILERSCRRFGNLPAYSNLGVTITYAELDRLTQHFAAFLQSLPGLKKGERVAIMMPNLLQYPVALFGVLRAGMVVVNVNPLYTARELEYQLKDSGARSVVVVENFAHTLQEVVDKTAVEHVVTTQIGDMCPIPQRWLVNFVVKNVKKMVPDWRIDGAIGFAAALRRGAGAPLQDVPLMHDDVAFLQYTGGTTGVPKGAQLTHGNIIANLQQASTWIANTLKEGSETIIAALPFYHVFCLTANILTFMKYGGHNVLITNPRDLPAFVKELEKWKFTAITGVNTLFNALMNTPGFDKLDFSTLKLALGGGAAVQRAVAERWQKITGKPLIEAYGLTEASPAACINPLTLEAYNGSIGLPIPSTDVSIREDDGKELPQGQIGEICIRGPQVMKGYWNMPEETAKTLTPDGWLKTGDVGYMDDNGFIYITDRKKDMIVVSGFKVFPNEVEGVLAHHPGVLESAAVGVPDDKSGEAVKVVVVKKDPSLTAEQVLAFCRERLAAYKVPKHVEFRSELKKSPIGKVLRKKLRDPAPAPEAKAA
jgi:long-chain acyl-CoA synthetase